MPKVTIEMMHKFMTAGGYPPRHAKGCLKNISRMNVLPYLATGLSIDEVKRKVKEEYKSLSCTCEK